MNPEERAAWDEIRDHDHERSTLPRCEPDGHNWDDVSPTDQAGVLLQCLTCRVFERDLRDPGSELLDLQEEWEEDRRLNPRESKNWRQR